MEQDYSYVLEYCNEVREALRRGTVKNIRKGIRVDICHCPVAATINFGARKSNYVEVDGTAVELPGEEEPRYFSDCPERIQNFILAFDDGHHSELEGEGWAE